jgi:RNA polymerase sigma factor (sigma-70 family)
MAHARLANALRHLRTVASLQLRRGETDAALLAAFTASRDEAAFAALVQRHGRMVLGVCRHVLGHEQDAEDAYQATFLVLARKASTIRGRETLANWLYGIAFRTAMRAKRDAARRRLRKTQNRAAPADNPAWNAAWREVQAILDEEIHRLPSKYRAPFILCHLEGKTRVEAAGELRCQTGTISSRLARARQRLQARLARRGITLSAALGATAVSQSATAAMPMGLAMATVRGALEFGNNAGVMPPQVGLGTTSAQVGSQALSASAVALAEGMMQTAILSKSLCAAFALVVLLVCGSAVGLFAMWSPASQGEPVTQASIAPKDDKSREPSSTAERLPQGAIARLRPSPTSKAGWPFALSFTADGKGLVAGSWDGFVSVWEPGSKQLVKEWGGNSTPVRTVAISSDGATVAEASGKSSGIRVWKKSTGELLKTFTRPAGEEDMTESLVFSPDGTFLAASGCTWPNYVKQGRFVRLWDLGTGNPVYQLDRPWSAGIHTSTFSRDGSTLIVALYDKNEQGGNAKGYVVHVDVKTGKEIKRLPLPPQRVPRWFPGGEHFALTSTGKWLVHIGSEEGPQANYTVVSAINMATGRKSEILKNEKGWGIPVEYALAPDERSIVVAFVDEPLVVAEIATGQIRGRYQNPDSENTSFAFSPDGRSLACGKADRTILFWDLTGRAEAGKLQPIRLTKNDLARLWGELQANDGTVIRRAIWELVAGAQDAVPFLREKLRHKPVDSSRIAALIKDLGSESFPIRAKAAKELEDWWDAAEPMLQQKLKEPVTLELRLRLEQVIQKMDLWSVPHQPIARAVEVLEHIASSDARQVLQEVAARETSPRLADEAKGALQRLALRH